MLKTLILSDLHLGASNAQTEAQLEVLHSRFDRLILNGDTVDHYDFRRFTPCHWAVLNRLKSISEERELVLIRGNHDCKLPFTQNPNSSFRLLEHLLGTRMVDEFELPLGRRRFLVLHGDQFDKTMNLSVVGEAADFVYRRVQKVSHSTARWLKAASKLVCGVVEQVKHRACSYARTKQLQGVIVGHTHFCCDEMVDGVRYLNCGSWVEQPCTYIMVEGDDVELRRWPLAASSKAATERRPLFEPAWTCDAAADGFEPELAAAS